MGERRGWGQSWWLALAAIVIVAVAPAALAATQYKYDAQGRLISVVYDDGKRITYTYDETGNRTQVVSAATTGNLPPVANTSPVTLTVNEGSGQQSVSTPRNKFTDPNGDTLTIAGSTHGARGTVAITSSTLKYDVNTGVSGPSTDSFVYSAKDPSGAYGTVVVVVTINNVAPNAVNDSITVNKNSFLAFTATANDTDPGNDAVRITAVSNPPHGTAVAVSSDVIQYTPDNGYTGSDSFTYTLTDEDGATDTATVTVTVSNVNNAPVANDDSIYAQISTARTFDPRTNDTDADGNALTITAKTNPSHGTVTFTSTSVTYTPTTGYAGTDTFTYTISDGTVTDTATVVMTVIANSAPDAVNDSRSVVVNTPSTFDPRTNDTDADNQSLTITALSSPSHGSATIGSGGGSVTYTPTTSYTGADSFTYTIQDLVGATDTATISITVSGSNTAPDAVNDTLEAAGPFGSSAVGSVDVLANDTDAEGQTLTITAVTSGTKGTVGYVGGVITYSTNTGSSVGTDSFTYTISDGAGGSDTATVSVSITRE
jgi:YD repeat-containing protein